ncbi:AAA family ATPase [Candidatus Bathyarchaeota archaeon]|nr:AAA family ATPase [Candidatus Bathyarchaeota archaeon]
MNNHRVETGVRCLDEALQGGLPEGSMTLIAGNPGTGKTLLSGEFLYGGAARGENCLYVSLSEGRHSFLGYMARVGRDFTAPEVKDRLTVMDLVTVKEEGLDILVEMVTSHLDETQTQRLVIDSFTAMSNAFTETIDARVTLHILSKILGQTYCTTLLITEIPTGTEKIGLGIEEFVADGIIVLRRNTLKGNVLRELEIIKMRGTPIEKPLHTFTLHKGFKVLPVFETTPVSQPRRYQPGKNSGHAYGTGNRQLDEITGGFRKGDTVYIELGDNISPIIPALILAPLRASFITANRGVLFLPPGGESVERITQFDRLYGVTAEEHRRLMRVATASPGEADAPVNLVLDSLDIRMSHRTWRDEEARLRGETGEPTLKIIYVDRLSNTWQETRCTGLLDTESMHTRSTGGLLVLLSRPGDEAARQHASNLAHTHLRLYNQRGVILLDGVKPQTTLYAVAQDNNMGYPSLSLTPIR